MPIRLNYKNQIKFDSFTEEIAHCIKDIGDGPLFEFEDGKILYDGLCVGEVGMIDIDYFVQIKIYQIDASHGVMIDDDPASDFLIPINEDIDFTPIIDALIACVDQANFK